MYHVLPTQSIYSVIKNHKIPIYIILLLHVSVPADEVYKVFQQFSSSDCRSVYELAQYLRARHEATIKAWHDIDAQVPDPGPLSSEESDQFNDPEFVSGIRNLNTAAYKVRIR